jgi:hypothetical protein
MTEPVKQFVEPRLDSARIARQWDAVLSRRRGAERRSRAVSLTAAWLVATALGVALVLDLALRRSEATPVADGTWLESIDMAGTRVTLAEGTKIVLEANSRVCLVFVHRDAVRIDIERGGVEVEPPDAPRRLPRRSFVVASRGYEARARGGQRFIVHQLASSIRVLAERGDVDVAAPDGTVHTVREGQAWNGQVGESPAADPSAAVAADATTRALTTPVLSARASVPSATQGPGVAPVPPENAKALFEEAQRARAEGRASEAARLFDKLRRTYRQDPRAGFSAFELGRLRLDAFGDPRGAEEALRDAMALAPESPFREDAEARHVQALSRLGDHDGCLAASQAYVARYPAGAYRKVVTVYCGSPP